MTSHVPALLVYAVLTIAYTWPLAFWLGDRVPHDLLDPLLSTWTLWWNAQVTPFTERWWDGLAFYPARDTLTFSDHRVGLGLIATPVIWLGGSPLAAHNLAFMLSFFLSATAAYALCVTVTQSRAAAFVGGLIFGFHPFRAHHLPHLELLSSYWLPVVLLALHNWSRTLRPKWLVVAAVALLMQALTSGYYFMFAGTLLALWLLWFTPLGLSITQYVALGVAFVVPLVAITPVLLKYREAHQSMGLSRTLLEIEHFSADLIGFLSAPRQLALWNSPESWQRPEGALFPGVIAVALTATALWVRRPGAGPAPATPAWTERLRLAVLAGASVMTAIAMIPAAFGPVAYEIAGIRVSVSDAHKPLSIATVLFAGWALTTARMRQAWRDRSPFALYLLATSALWLFALGPTARLLGQRVLYKAPYSWLMLLPGFRDGFRVPARFAMLAALTLSVAASLAFSRLVQGRSMNVRLTAAVLIGTLILVESWIEPLPTFAPPPALVIPAAVPPEAVILELPLDMKDDAAAMYRSMGHRRRTVNGMSGYDAPHYAVLRAALAEGRIDVLDRLAKYGTVAIFVPRDERGGEWVGRLTARTNAKHIGATETHEVLLLPHVAQTDVPPPSHQRQIPIRLINADSNAKDVALMADGNLATAWLGAGPQHGVEQFIAELGDVVAVGGVALVQGPIEFPRGIAVDLSTDGITWSTVWEGETAAKMLTAAIESPGYIRLYFPFVTHQARYVRVRQLGTSQAPWAVSEVAILAPEP